MGGCASKPKEFIKSADPPIKSKKPQPETGASENTDEGENSIEKPPVQVSESKEEAQPSSSDEQPATVPAGGEPVSSKDDVNIKADSKNNDNTIEPVKKTEVDSNSRREEATSSEPKEE